MSESGPPPSPLTGGDLARWVEAGLISGEQAERIAAFELDRQKERQRGNVARAVALLGGLTLVSGVGSLIAYNWDRFGDGVKLAGMGLLLVAALFAVARVKRESRSEEGTALDVTLLITNGLTLAGLSLVSQIYHQDGELWQLLFAWCALCAPLMSFSRTRFATVFWYLGLFFSLMTAFDDFDRYLRDAFRLESDHAAWIVLLLSGTASALLAARFSASRFSGRRAAGLMFSNLHLLALGLFGGLFWFHGEDGAPLLWLLGLLSGVGWALSVPPSIERLGWGSRTQVRVLWSVGLLLAVLPMGLPVESGFAAFASFVAFWSLAWTFAERAGSTKNARAAVFFLGARIVIASFELFESLLVTGTVLVGLGALALVWSRMKWSSEAAGEKAHD